MGKPQRVGMALGIKKEKIEEYKKLHANVWPDIAEKIRDCNISNYSIYIAETEPGKYCLFSYFEYTGDDFDADMKKMADDPRTQEWWEHCMPCQYRLPTCPESEWWMPLEEAFHQD